MTLRQGFALLMLLSEVIGGAHCVAPTPRREVVTRRQTVAGVPWLLAPSPALAAPSLRDALSTRKAGALRKPILNVPPGAFEFPEWFAGEWEVSSSFAGYELCATKIPKQRVVEDVEIPGFQKLSIADIADVGSDVRFRRRYHLLSGKVREDRRFNLEESVEAHLGQGDVVTAVELDDDRNPNRATIRLREGSRNGELVELLTNARRSERSSDDDDFFFSAESLRQVNVGPPSFSQPGVPRLVIGEYQHFYTYRRLDPAHLRANLLTAAYLQPNDPLFQDAFDEPVVLYSHNLDFRRRPASA